MITTERDVFVGAHVTNVVKERLRAEAARRDMSMSALVAEAIEEKLVDVPIAPVCNPNEADVPLPFETRT